MNSNKTQGLREGAMMTALTLVLIAASEYIPFFALVGIFVCGLPMALLAARNDLRTTAIAFVAVTLLTCLITGDWIYGVSTILMSVLPCAAAGYMLGSRKSFYNVLFASTVAVSLGWMFEILMLNVVSGVKIGNLLSAYQEQSRNIMMTSLEGMSEYSNVEKAEIQNLMTQMLQSTIDTLQIYIPSLVVIVSLVLGYIYLRLSGFIIKRTKAAQVDVLPFSHIKAPASMCIVGLAAYFISILLGTESAFGAVFANAEFILYTCIGICGLSFVDFKFKETVKIPFLRWIIYIVCYAIGSVFVPILPSVLMIIGILDSGRDFRGLNQQQAD